ncbi:MAG: hypothetical protein QXX12_02600 [Nanopusillaceae archaeon]
MSDNVLRRDLEGYWLLSGIGVIIWAFSFFAPFVLLAIPSLLIYIDHTFFYLTIFFFYLVGNILLLIGLYGVSTKLNVKAFKTALTASIIAAVAIFITDLMFSASISAAQYANFLSSGFIFLISLAILNVALITSSSNPYQIHGHITLSDCEGVL